KGTLILRDLPLLLEAAERTRVGAAVSVGTADRDLARLVEPGAPPPRARLETVAALNEAGIGCGVLMGPVIPYLSDSPAQLESAVRQIADAGAVSVSAITLHLRPGAREWFLAWLREHHPGLVAPYARLYRGGAYAPRDYQERISRQVRELAARHGITGRERHRAAPPRPEAPAPAAPKQLSLLWHRPGRRPDAAAAGEHDNPVRPAPRHRPAAAHARGVRALRARASDPPPSTPSTPSRRAGRGERRAGTGRVSRLRPSVHRTRPFACGRRAVEGVPCVLGNPLCPGIPRRRALCRALPRRSSEERR